jgi:hypothetical protein
MSWLSKLIRRKPAEDVFAEFSTGGASDGRPWTAPLPSKASGQGTADEGHAFGFSTSAGGLLGGGNARGGADRRYRHAFTPSQPVADVRRLAGRTVLMRRVIRSIEDQDLHVVLFGDRGIGKTSVLKVIQGLAMRANYLVHYVSCGQTATFAEVFRSLTNRIPLLYDGRSDPTAGDHDSANSLADYLPDGDFSVSQLTEVLSRVEGTRILLILDEFDRSDVDQFRRPIGELIKNLSDRAINVQLLIGGVAANLSELVAHVPSIRRNIVGIGVPNLDHEEVGEMLDIAETSGNIRFDPKARKRLAEVSAGLPYLVGLIGQHAVLEAADGDNSSIGAVHVDRAVAVACTEIASRLSLRCNFALDRVVAPQADLLEHAAVEATRQSGLIVDPALTAALRQHANIFNDILQPMPDDPRGGWHFIEDGTASVVWLRKVLGGRD